MKGKSLKAVVAAVAVLLVSVVPVVPSGAIGSTLYTKAEWKKIRAEAKGQTVNWYMWGGGQKINEYVNNYLAVKAKKLGVTLNQVKLNGTAEAVNKVLGEKQAGNNKRGSVDMIWINGENFATGVQAKIWDCKWSTKLPNSRYVNWKSPAVNLDFGLPVNGCESPWARASSGLVYDSAVLSKTDVSSMENFIAWVKKNPGKFTYAAPPDFNGSMTVRRMFYHANGGADKFAGKFNQSVFDQGMQKTAKFLNDLEPYLWRQGQTYPATIGDVQKLYANGEISAFLDYGAINSFTQVEAGLWPTSTRVTAFKEGMIGNISYVTIPYNSPNKAGAQVIANIMISPAAQMKLQIDGVVGSPAIDMKSTPLWAAYQVLPVKQSSASPAVLAKNGLPELTSEWLKAIDAGWAEQVQK